MTQNATMNFAEWAEYTVGSLWGEVKQYADSKGVSYKDAMWLLVHKGLRDVEPPWQQQHVEPYRRPGQR